jgi:hypothetical protein
MYVCAHARVYSFAHPLVRLDKDTFSRILFDTRRHCSLFTAIQSEAAQLGEQRSVVEILIRLEARLECGQEQDIRLEADLAQLKIMNSRPTFLLSSLCSLML